MKTALTIAGSDPTGGAGFQADLRTFRALDVYGFSIPTVLTAQNTKGVVEIKDLPADFFSLQIDTLLKDTILDASKTGMIYHIDLIKVIARKLSDYSLRNLVVDPVAASSTGVVLTEEGMLEALRNYIFPLARVVTPNLYETFALTGIDIQNESDYRKAATELKKSGPDTVIITGGHAKGKAMDLLFDGDEFITLETEMLEGEYHGTGCVFSAAITAGLAHGWTVKESFVKAKDFVYNAMKSAHSVGKGMKVLHI